MRRLVPCILVLMAIVASPLWGAEKVKGAEKATAPVKKTAPANPAVLPMAPLPAPGPDGFITLLNGKDLTGWMNARGGAPGTGWTVADGAVTLERSKGGGGDLWTQHRFGDFVLDLEFKTEGNSGVFIRTDKPTDNVQTGIEIQIERPAKKPDKHSVGSIYDALAPTKDPTKPNEWNHAVITCNKNRITVEMNGEKMTDIDLDQWSEPGKNPDGSKNKFRQALKDFKREGHIGLQDHGAKVAYRNIKIKQN
jgi:hypothetical protein